MSDHARNLAAADQRLADARLRGALLGVRFRALLDELETLRGPEDPKKAIALELLKHEISVEHYWNSSDDDDLNTARS